MSDTKYGSGLLATITINSIACANSLVFELPEMTANNITVQGADGPQLIPDVINSYGRIVATVPYATANVLASTGAVPGTVPTHITVSGTIPANPTGFQNFTATGFLGGEKGGTVKRGSELSRMVTIDLDSFISWS